MDRKRGVRPRGATSIQIDFYYHGQRCREPLKLEPTKANLKFAENLKAKVLHEIAIGTFDYAKSFPNSKNASLGSKSSNKTISEALDEYLKASQRTLELSTLKGYRSAIEYHLKPAFGHLRLVDLTASHIKTWIGTLSISAKRINNVLIPLRTISGDAFSDGIIERNAMHRIKNLPVRHEEPQPLSPEEIKSIVNEMPDQGKNLIIFAVWTGLRTSELIALEWGDIDWKSGNIRVTKACVNKHTKYPKTKAGERDVKLLPPALEALNKQKQFSLIAGKQVFFNPHTNHPWETDAQIRRTLWMPALKRAGIAYRNPYQTRHTYASTLLSIGENPMWVSKQMGHKDWGMLRKRYGRFIPEVDSAAGEKAIALWSQNGHTGLVND